MLLHCISSGCDDGHVYSLPIELESAPSFPLRFGRTIFTGISPKLGKVGLSKLAVGGKRQHVKRKRRYIFENGRFANGDAHRRDANRDQYA